MPRVHTKLDCAIDSKTTGKRDVVENMDNVVNVHYMCGKEYSLLPFTTLHQQDSSLAQACPTMSCVLVVPRSAYVLGEVCTYFFIQVLLSAPPTPQENCHVYLTSSLVRGSN